MHRQWWNSPVTVETRKPGQRLTISTCEAAAVFMLRNWPSKPKGRSFKAARALLVDAHAGKADVEVARTAFLAVIEESGIKLFE